MGYCGPDNLCWVGTRRESRRPGSTLRRRGGRGSDPTWGGWWPGIRLDVGRVATGPAWKEEGGPPRAEVTGGVETRRDVPGEWGSRRRSPSGPCVSSLAEDGDSKGGVGTTSTTPNEPTPDTGPSRRWGTCGVSKRFRDVLVPG